MTYSSGNRVPTRSAMTFVQTAGLRRRGSRRRAPCSSFSPCARRATMSSYCAASTLASTFFGSSGIHGELPPIVKRPLDEPRRSVPRMPASSRTRAACRGTSRPPSSPCARPTRRRTPSSDRSPRVPPPCAARARAVRATVRACPRSKPSSRTRAARGAAGRDEGALLHAAVESDGSSPHVSRRASSPYERNVRPPTARPRRSPSNR